MDQKKKVAATLLPPLEADIIVALTTGDDGRVPLQARVSVCLALHDFSGPQAAVFPPGQDPGHLRERFCLLVDWSLRVNWDTVSKGIRRWFDQGVGYLKRQAEQAKTQYHPTMN